MKHKKLLSLLLAATLIIGLVAGCSKKEGAQSENPASEASEEEKLEYPVQVGDYTVLARPRRVVSLSPALTEKLYDLGLEERLVGVSNYCDYPAGTAQLEACGTAEIPNLEMIDELDAHMVISETPLDPEDIEQLQKWNIDVVVLPHARSLKDLYDSYESLYRVMEGEYAGGELGQRFVTDLEAWVTRLRQAVSGEERKVALYIRKMPFTLATGDTLENDLFDIIGLDNAMAEETGWSISEEKARGDSRAKFEAVEVMFFDSGDPDFPVTMKGDLEKSDFYKGLQATLKDWYLEIDNQVMERQSLRTFRQLLDMAAYAHPDATLPPFILGGGTSQASQPDPEPMEPDGEDGDNDSDNEPSA